MRSPSRRRSLLCATFPAPSSLDGSPFSGDVQPRRTLATPRVDSMNRLLLFSFAAAVSFGVSSPSRAAVFHVPSIPTPTIASALAVALNGDRIEVAPGTYFESSLSMTKGVTLVGTGGASQTTIDAQGLGNVLNISSFPSATVEGFTITGGIENTEGGGGIKIDSGGSSATHVIRDCIIAGNSASRGGGIYFTTYSGILVEGCILSDNVAGYGGGVCGFLRGRMTMSNCVIERNRADTGGGVATLISYEFAVIDCTIRDNEATGDHGGGLLLSSQSTVRNSIILDNVAAAEGGGLMAYGSSGTVVGSVFRGNRAGTLGGAISLGDGAGSTPYSIDACTIAANEAPQGGGIFLASDSNKLRRCILAFATSGEAVGCGAGATPVLTCCDLYGNAGGDAICGVDGGGNFSLDPQFCDLANGDVALHDNSPCLSPSPIDGFVCGGDVGALGAGCGPATDVDPFDFKTWGRIKGFYR